MGGIIYSDFQSPLRRTEIPCTGTLMEAQDCQVNSRRRFLHVAGTVAIGITLTSALNLRCTIQRSQSSKGEEELNSSCKHNDVDQIVAAARTLLARYFRETNCRCIKRPISLLQRNLRLSYSVALQIASALEHSGDWTALEDGCRMLLRNPCEVA